MNAERRFMRTSDKILLILLALINYAVAILVIMSVGFNVRIFDDILTFSLHNEALESICCIFVVVLTAILGTGLLSIVFRSGNYRLEKRNDTVKLSDNGSVEITYEALRSMTKKKCMTFKFVSDCSTDVNMTDGQLTLYIRLRPYPDTILTDEIEKLKSELARTVERQTGIVVQNIKVLVLSYKAHKS